MALSPSIIKGAILVKGAPTVHGSKMPAIAKAISSAVVLHILTMAKVSSTNTVMGPGAGSKTGFIQGMMTSDMSTKIALRAASFLFTGKDLKRLCDAISFGIVQGLRVATNQGTVVGGGPGTGVGTIMGLNTGSLKRIILAQFSGSKIMGSKTPKLAEAIAFGVFLHLSTIPKVTTVCVGAFAPPPAGPVPVIGAGIGPII